MSLITVPTLPPKAGYVEVELNGEHFYRNIVTGELLGAETEQPSMEKLQQENKLLKAQLQAQSNRSDFIEDCIAEMATQVYGGV